MRETAGPMTSAASLIPPGIGADQGAVVLHPFLQGGGAMAERILHHRWEDTPLGPLSGWPQSLRSTVEVMLGSRLPMFVAWGPEKRLIYNDAYAGILQGKHPQALGSRFEQVWAEIWDEIEPLVRRCAGGESLFLENLPLTMQRKGVVEQTWFTFSYSPVRDESGAISGLYCACTETTGIVQAEHQQRAQQEHLQRLFQQAPGFIAVMRGPDHVFELTNEAFVQLTGQRQAVGRKLAELMPEVVDQGLIELLDEVFRSGKAYVGRSVNLVIHRDPGRVTDIWVDFVYQPLVDHTTGRVTGVFLQGQEVTERHRAEEALRLFSDSIPAIAWTSGPDGHIEQINAQWTAYTGLSQPSALGLGWLEAVHPDDRSMPWDMWRAARATGQQWQGEYRLRGQDQNYRWFMTRAVAQRDSTGHVVKWFGTTTDIEEARRSQDALNEADRQKDEFLATLAHELRNPLAPIRTAAHVLSSAQLSPGALAKTTDVIKRQVSQMARLLDDLLDVARITKRQLQLKKDYVSVAVVVATAVETARPLIDAKHHHLKVTLPPRVVQLEADPVRMAQVLANLLNNAAKYTDAGGQISLTVHNTDRECVFEVRDTGIGLKPQALSKIFTMFAQEAAALDRAEGGLGIGLALVKGLVELHGGSVDATSAGPGRGSTFTVRLPHRSDTRLDPASGPRELAAPKGQPVHCRVLIADDNSDAAESLAMLLRLDGHQICVAHDGEEALQLAEKERPGVMVLDIGMPGMNGYELASRIRQEAWGKHPLIVAATGWGQEDDKFRAIAAGFNAHLTKPFDPNDLLRLIHAHQDRRAQDSD